MTINDTLKRIERTLVAIQVELEATRARDAVIVNLQEWLVRQAMGDNLPFAHVDKDVARVLRKARAA